jgi:hypothetical protein
MVNDHPVAFAKPSKPRAALRNLAAGLMACNFALVTLRPFAHMLAINAANIASTYSGRFHLNQHFAVARLWNFKIFEFDSAVTRKNCAFHHENSL